MPASLTKLFFWTPGHRVCLFTGSLVYPFTYACFKYLSSFDSLLMILRRSVRSSLSSRSRPSRRRRRTYNEASRENDGMWGRARGGTQWRSREFITCCVMWQKKKKMVGPREMHRNLGTLTISNFLPSFLGCPLSLRCHTWDQTKQPLGAGS